MVNCANCNVIVVADYVVKEFCCSAVSFQVCLFKCLIAVIC